MMEAIVATAIATIAILGLAHTFGLGQGFVDKFEIARTALATAQARMEALSVTDPTSTDLSIGAHPTPAEPFLYHGANIGTETWRVEWFDDPITPAITTDLRRVTVVIAWNIGADGDSLSLTRLFPN
jgi:hypothetical protein